MSPPELGGITTLVGAGSSAIITGGINAPTSLMRLQCSTATGRAQWMTPLSFVMGSEINFETVFRIPVPPTTTEYTIYLLGLGGNYSAGTDEHSNGAYIYWDYSGIYATTKVTGQATQYVQFTSAQNNVLNNIKINCKGDNVKFNFNGEIINMTGMPTDALGVLFHAFKLPSQTGVTDAFLDIDYARLELIN